LGVSLWISGAYGANAISGVLFFSSCFGFLMILISGASNAVLGPGLEVSIPEVMKILRSSNTRAKG
jgi:hypothetical protein